jgi:hypothetical protein
VSLSVLGKRTEKCDVEKSFFDPFASVCGGYSVDVATMDMGRRVAGGFDVALMVGFGNMDLRDAASRIYDKCRQRHERSPSLLAYLVR